MTNITPDTQYKKLERIHKVVISKSEIRFSIGYCFTCKFYPIKKWNPENNTLIICNKKYPTFKNGMFGCILWKKRI